MSVNSEKTPKAQAELAKKHGAFRAQFVRRHAIAWMEKYKKSILEKFVEEAWKRYPVGEKSNEFELDESLLEME
jgi:hypothetical protein